MKRVAKLITYMSHAAASKLILLAIFAVLTGAIVGVNALSGTTARAATCDPNDIMPCGAASASQFLSKYRQNSTGDMPGIYSHYDLTASELERFGKTAKLGTAYKNGDIVVDGKVVAKNGVSLGRDKKANSQKVTIGGKTYYADSSQNVFVPNSMPVLVMMNGERFEFGALTPCGNPITGTPTGQAPRYSCDMLNRTQVNRTTYRFSTKANALHGAKVTKVVYDFGDGTKTEKTNPAESVTHSYTKNGTFTAKVTVHIAVNGETKTVTGTQCSKPVEVKPEAQKPIYACDSLTATTITKERRHYRFSAKTSQSGGATLKSASFTFDDGQTASDITPADANTVSVEHTFANAGSYTIVATVSFNTASGVKSATCQTKITPEQQPPAECKPGIPVGDELCEEETPAQLPTTGPAEMIGASLGIGSLVAAGTYYFRTRRSLLDVIWRR